MKLRLNKIDTRINSKAHNTKEIMKRIRKAGMIGNKLEIEVAKKELELIEKEKE